MAYISEYNGVIFCESNIDASYKIKGPVDCKLGGFYAQIKSIDDVKRVLCKKAKALGANAIINFNYGQKKKLLSFEGVIFYGSGTAVFINNIDEILRNVNKLT